MTTCLSTVFNQFWEILSVNKKNHYLCGESYSISQTIKKFFRKARWFFVQKIKWFVDFWKTFLKKIYVYIFFGIKSMSKYFKIENSNLLKLFDHFSFAFNTRILVRCFYTFYNLSIAATILQMTSIRTKNSAVLNFIYPMRWKTVRIEENIAAVRENIKEGPIPRFGNVAIGLLSSTSWTILNQDLRTEKLTLQKKW